MTLVRSSLLGAGIGATSMFLLDPARGARRRAILRDKMTSASRRTVEAAGATFRDLSNRFEGVQSRTRNLFAADAVDNAALAERVKSALGRVTAHHRAISVRAADGWVTLYGDVLESERRSIISAVERIRGVAGVENNLRIHLFADNVPALQGGSPGRAQWTWLTDSWSPAAILAGGAAIAVAAAALLRLRTDRLTAAAINEW